MQFTKIHQKLAKPVYEAIPKIAKKAGKKWEWNPKVGEFWIDDDGKVNCIGDKLYLEHVCYLQKTKLAKITPLLYWEDHLEPILEGFGWVLWDMGRTVPSSDGTGSLVVVELAKGESLRCGRGKDRQEAFQRAVLAVAEKLGEKE